MSADAEPPRRPLHLFEAYGIELEYMIVDRETLAVRPIADRLLTGAGGGYELEVERGPASWSNELALHVIEMKTNGPTPSLAGWGQRFQAQVAEIDALLAPMGARLMPSAMHPWMSPDAELRLWPHENDVIYQTFDRIFDCRGHGWANLQSMHINLPFGDDEEFGRLHAAIRCALPILPALAASSPYVDGAAAPALDMRMEVYRGNARRVPSVSGLVIPERVFTRADYEGVLLQGIYDDLEAVDPEGVLRHEWVNARGCIARFERGAIEIRVLDLQEHPGADLAVAGAVIAIVRALVEERTASGAAQRAWGEAELAQVLRGCIRDGEAHLIDDEAYLALWGWTSGPCTAGALWRHLCDTIVAEAPGYDEWAPSLARILDEGTLATRLRRIAGLAPTREALAALYRRLCDCLAAGEGLSAPRP
jgi:carboxylate-amine ligase